MKLIITHYPGPTLLNKCDKQHQCVTPPWLSWTSCWFSFEQIGNMLSLFLSENLGVDFPSFITSILTQTTGSGLSLPHRTSEPPLRQYMLFSWQYLIKLLLTHCCPVIGLLFVSQN